MVTYHVMSAFTIDNSFIMWIITIDALGGKDLFYLYSLNCIFILDLSKISI